MTDQEEKVIDLLADAFNAHTELPIIHPSDQEEFCFHIHALQNIVFAREGQRNCKGSTYNAMINPSGEQKQDKP